MNKWLQLLWSVSLMVFVGCGPQTAGGSSTTVGNPVVAGIVVVDGAPVSNAKVYLLPKDTLFASGDTIPFVVSGVDGSFDFGDSITEGEYRLSLVTDDNTMGYLDDVSLLQEDTLNVTIAPVEMSCLAFSMPLVGGAPAVSGTPFVGDSTLFVPVGAVSEVVSVDGNGVLVDTLALSVVATDDAISIDDRIVHRVVARSPDVSAIGTCEGVIVSDLNVLYTISSGFIYRKPVGEAGVTESFSGALRGSVAALSGDRVYAGGRDGLVFMDNGASSRIYSSTSGLASDTIEALASYGEKLLVGVPGAFQILHSGTWSTLAHPQELTSSVVVLEPLSDSVTLLGTVDGGMWVLTITTADTLWSHISLADLGYSAEGVQAIARFDDSTVWLITNTEVGLWSIGGASASIVHSSGGVSDEINGAVYDTTNAILYLLKESGVILWEGTWNPEKVLSAGEGGFAVDAVIGKSYATNEAVVASLNGASAIKSIWAK